MFGFVTFLKDGLLDTTSLGKSDLWGLSTSDDEAITQSCGEGVPLGILDRDNSERSLVLLDVHHGTHSSTIVSLGDHDHGSQVEFEGIGHLSGGDVDLDGVVDLGIRVGVSDGPSVVSDGARDLVGTNVDLVDPAELVLGFFSVNSVQDVTSLSVVHKTETIVRLFQFYDIHETGRVVVVGADLSVNLDATLHANLLALLVGQGVLKALTEDNSDGQALTKLVRTSGRTTGPDTSHLLEVPVFGRMKALQMLFRSTSPVRGKRNA